MRMKESKVSYLKCEFSSRPSITAGITAFIHHFDRLFNKALSYLAEFHKTIDAKDLKLTEKYRNLLRITL